MKTIIQISLALLLSVTFAFAQVGVPDKINTGKSLQNTKTKTSIVKQEATVKLSEVDMHAISNANSATEMANNKKINSDTKVNDKSQALEQYARDRLNEEIFGSETEHTYAVAYEAKPVKDAYQKYIEPNINLWLEEMEEAYDPKNLAPIIAKKIADQLMLFITNSNAYTTGFSRIALRNAIMKEFENEEFPSESESPEYYKDHVWKIFQATSSLLKTCPFNSSAPCEDDRWHSQQVITSFQARANCAIGAIFGRGDVKQMFNSDKKVIALRDAKIGILYHPVTQYKFQPNAYDVFALRMKALQNATQKGTLYSFYDKYYNCPSITAFEPVNASKLRSSVIVSK